MTLTKTTRLKALAKNFVFALSLLVIVGTVGYQAKAYSDSSASPNNVFENATVTINQSQTSQTEDKSAALGAVSSPYSNDPMQCIGDDCRYFYNGAFIDASTTIVSVSNPFLTPTTTASDVVVNQVSAAFGYTAATATVDLVRLTPTVGATTTYEVDCSASGNPGTTTTAKIIDTESNVATSTVGIIESGMASTTNPGMGSLVSLNNGLGAAAVTKILLTPSKPFLVCKVWQPYGTSLDAFTSVVNAFAGNFLVRISRSL